MLRQIKRITQELKPFKTAVIIVAISGMVMSLAQWQLAVNLKVLFEALESRDSEKILKIPQIILAITLFMVIGRYFHLSTMNYTADRVTMGLRFRLQKKFMDLSQNFHQNFESGSGGLISRILSDITVIQHGLRLVADFFTQPLSFCLLFGLLFYRDWKLTLFILVFLPFLVAFLKQVGRSLRKYGTNSQTILEKVATVIKESLDGVRVIQSFRLENEMARRFETAANDYLRNRKKIHARGEAASPVTEFIATSVTMVIFVYIGMEISKGSATIGDFGSYLGALFMLQQPIKKIQESFVKIQETFVALDRVYAILDDDNRVPEVKDGVNFPQLWDKIEYSNVNFSYKDVSVLKNINLEIKRGQVIALVGESGSGKSTIVNLLERFFDPTQGTIRIGGLDIKQISLNDLRKNVALVTQDVFLFSESVARNIHAGDFSKGPEGIEAAAKTANAHDFIMAMSKGYDNPVGDRGNFLSGGEKQRVSIARAIFKDAPILILDEATSALDSASELEVQKGLEQLMKNRTTIVIAHRLSTVLHADKIIVMKKGEILEAGTHQELLSQNGEYSKFIQLQKLL